jgi:aryl-alcohol dehydrogenase-like predicted oxidoreductase
MLEAMTDMTYRRLGSSGLVVSTVGIGCNNFGLRISADASRTVVDAAIDAGITLFDTSDSYGDSELILGELLGNRRDDVILATKFGSDVNGRNGKDFGARGARRYIRRAIESSLARLRTDYVDLYQLHKPDPSTPLEETLSALDELVTEGKVRYVGSSNLAGWQVADAEWQAQTRHLERFVSAQNQWSLLERGIEGDLVPACERYGIGILPYFPLASGLLTGKYRRGEAAPEDSRYKAWGMEGRLTDERFSVVEKLSAFAGERSISLLDVAIGWLAAQPAVSSVIAGATKADQVRSNAAAAAWRPTPEDLKAINDITTG